MSRYNTKLIRRNNLYPSYGRAQESNITNLSVFLCDGKNHVKNITLYVYTFVPSCFAPSYIDAHMNFDFVFLGPMQKQTALFRGSL
jgi:hypothetical protein